MLADGLACFPEFRRLSSGLAGVSRAQIARPRPEPGDQDEHVGLVWVAGVSGAGKSSVCAALKGKGYIAVDADWDGFSRWVNRVSDVPASDTPYRIPPGWLSEFGWQVRPEAVRSLSESLESEVGFLCGGFENVEEVRNCFDQIICLVIHEATLRYRLANRTTNDFGKNPDELQAALGRLRWQEDEFRRLGATIIDATQPLEVVAALVETAGVTGRLRPLR